MGGGEHEAEAEAVDRLADPLRRLLEDEAERLEHVGGAGCGADGPVAVLRHRRAGRGGDDRRSRGDVQRPAAVATGADDVHQVVPARPDGKNVRAHRLGAARDLVRCLSLRAQCDQEAGDLGLRRLAGHDPRHHLARLLAREVPAVHDLGDRACDHERKFLAIAGPSGVRTLSGWNWTPSIRSSVCRTPITSPSEVRDVTSSASGTVVAASE